MKEVFSQQLEREAERCRKAVERVPEGRNQWKPHEKSMELGYLATLVATMPSWITMAIERDELDLNPPEGPGYKPMEWTERSELVAALDDSVAKARKALEATSDEQLKENWRLLVAGQVVAEDPRYMVITEVFNHLAHHRGQLTVYLRLNDQPVPAIYGPSADEKTFG